MAGGRRRRVADGGRRVTGGGGWRVGWGKNGGMEHNDLMAGPPATYLPEHGEAEGLLAGGADPKEVAAKFPEHSGAWAALAERASADGEVVQAYAYARTGYHRGLDQLRRAGWHGHGPIPWEHEPNRGFLRSLHMLGKSAAAIGEDEEAQRCADFLRDSSPAAADELGK
jgi:Protein of unknown function (DUF3151)